jgi:hypothetical protein
MIGVRSGLAERAPRATLGGLAALDDIRFAAHDGLNLTCISPKVRKVPPEVNIPLSSFHGPSYEGFDRCHLRMACPVHDVEGATRHRHVR